MAEVKNDEEEQQHAYTKPEKRKPDLKSVDEIENGDSKKQKSEVSAENTNSYSVAEEKEIDDEGEEELEDEDDSEDEDEDEEDEDDEDEDEDGDEHSNGKAVVDRKGKGILREDKGKGKLIQDSDDSSDGGDESDGDSSDLSDDPLAEVDLDNILPSRTRRRVIPPGVHISSGIGNNDDDDSNDSAA